MRRALDLYYCDILEFHYHALHFLSRPGESLHVLFSLGRDDIDQQKGGEGSLALLGRHSKRNSDVFLTV